MTASPSLALPVPAAEIGRTPWKSGTPAYVNLSRDLVAVFVDREGRLLNQIDLGQLGLSVREAWDRAAFTLLHSQKDFDRVEFLVRNASFALGPHAPRGYELASFTVPPAAWLAHPTTFQLLHRHFLTVLRPREGLVYVSTAQRDLFVLDTTVENVVELAPAATVMTYSLGFPLRHHPKS